MSQNSRNQGFSYYINLMIEGSGAGSGSGSIPLTNGSGSGRPKNTCIRIRIQNTAAQLTLLCPLLDFQGLISIARRVSFIDTVYRIKEFFLDWQTLHEAATVDTEHCYNKAVNREDKRSRRYRDRDFAKFERSRRYRDRYRC
jgi:hypothetical protein